MGYVGLNKYCASLEVKLVMHTGLICIGRFRGIVIPIEFNCVKYYFIYPIQDL
jgi:hypothetical protein